MKNKSPKRIKYRGATYQKVGSSSTRRTARFMEPVIEYGEWVMVDGPMGLDAVPAEYADMGEVADLQEDIAQDKQPSLKGTSLGDFTENDEVWDIEVVKGYGAYMSAPGYMDRTETTVWPTKEEALEDLKENYMDPEDYPEYFSEDE